MVLKECPYCHIEVDKRGYTQHVRKCREIYEIKEAENMIKEDHVKEDVVKEDVVKEDVVKEEPESKNSKTPLLLKMRMIVLGTVVLVITLILTLISPKSKESKEKPTSETPQRRIARRSR